MHYTVPLEIVSMRALPRGFFLIPWLFDHVAIAIAPLFSYVYISKMRCTTFASSSSISIIIKPAVQKSGGLYWFAPARSSSTFEFFRRDVLGKQVNFAPRIADSRLACQYPTPPLREHLLEKTLLQLLPLRKLVFCLLDDLIYRRETVGNFALFG